MEVEGLTISVPKNRPTGGSTGAAQASDIEAGAHDDGGGERRILVDNATFTIPRGALVAVVGANGSGKSTLMQTLLGMRAPDAGKV